MVDNTARFQKELESLLNKYSQENASNTPDYILANYLITCLNAFDCAVNERYSFYGGDGDACDINTMLTKDTELRLCRNCKHRLKQKERNCYENIKLKTPHFYDCHDWESE